MRKEIFFVNIAHFEFCLPLDHLHAVGDLLILANSGHLLLLAANACLTRGLTAQCVRG